MRQSVIEERIPLLIKNHEEYNYILEWAKRNPVIHDVKTLFDFIFRVYKEEELEKFGEEPLKIAWNSLLENEKIMLTNKLSEIYLNRLK